jgi:sulfatase modifying factor 1
MSTFRVCPVIMFSLLLAATSQAADADVNPTTAQPVTAKAAPRPTVATVGHIGQYWTNSLGMKFAYIPAGDFTMGSPASEPGRDANELQHPVRIAQPFLMGAYPVTRGQFAAFVTATGYKTQAELSGNSFAIMPHGTQVLPGANWRNPGFDQDDRHPVVCVCWNDARAMIRWLSERDDLPYRLPSEAEWEYACRAGTQTTYPWGDNADGGAGWANCADLTFRKMFPSDGSFNWDDGYVYTSPVGSFRPNGWGLYDMIGNVAQWCVDEYGENPVIDLMKPKTPGTGWWRVARGGSWSDSAQFCRVAHRAAASGATGRCTCIGFRLALSFH